MAVFFLALKGAAVGAANVMPGISGATLAVIFRIYDRLIGAINGLTADWRGSLRFLVPFGLGMGAGILLGASVVSMLIGRFSFQSAGFIAGLMAGSLPFLYGQATQDGALARGKRTLYIGCALLAALGIGAAAVFVGTPGTYFEGTPGVGAMALLFFGGMLGAAAMVVPGVSGAMVLVLLGIYPIAMEAINQIRLYLADPLNFTLLPPILRIVIPVGLGIIPGILLAGRAIAWLLQKHFALTYFIIIGLVLGTIFALFHNPDTYQSGAVTPLIAAAAGLLFLCGLIVALALGRRQGDERSKE